MATKKIKIVLKLNLKAGEANPAPPIGPTLGQHGVNIMQFCQAYNEQTKDQKGQLIPAEITIFEDRTFTFITKLPPVSELIKQKLRIAKGAKTTGSETVATITKQQAQEIAQQKLKDLNTTNLDSATKTVIGTAKSMGVRIE